MNSEEAPKRTWKELAFGEHVALTLSVLAFAITSAKLLMVSHGDLQTATGILSIRGWSAMPTLLIVMLPTFAVVVTAIALLDLIERVREGDPLGRLPLSLALLIPLSAITGPRNWVLIYGALAISMLGISLIIRVIRAGIRRINSKSLLVRILGGSRLRISYPASATFLLFGVVGLIVAVASPKPWLPLERLTAVGHGTITGYVLGQDADRTAVLLDSTRQIAWIRSDDVLRRETCAQDLDDRAFLPSLIWPDPPGTAACSAPEGDRSR